MYTLLKGAEIVRGGRTERLDVSISDGVIVAIEPDISPVGFDQVFLLDHCFLLPGFVDVHVHLREPGFSFKETIRTGTLSAARGGYTAVCSMPNLKPPPDSPEHLQVQEALIARDAVIPVYPYAAITVGQKGAGELADYVALKDRVIGFSDDGKGVQSEATMRRAMQGIHAVGGLLAAHCEDETLIHGGYIHEGEYARLHGHLGICPESEWGQVKRDLELVYETGCRYHVCHVSTKQSVALIREAKAKGLPVTCETAPHYLCLTDMELQDEGRFRMNPPIRSVQDRDALIEGLEDGTIDLIATDHAPHAASEKDGSLRKSVMGVVGLETAFPVLYTRFVKTGRWTLHQLVHWMSEAPARAFSLPGGRIEVGERADLAVYDLDQEYEVDPGEFLSMGKATPFQGMRVFGRNRMTMVKGEIAWSIN